MSVVWSFPTRIVFGVGAARETGEHCRALKITRALVVTDPGVVKAGLVEPVRAALASAGIEAAVFSEVAGNPVEKNVRDGRAAYRDHRADGVVALGGGSALDVAKLIRLVVNHHRPLVDYDDATGGDRYITADVPPMIALPTTAGTGSEVGRSGVVTLDANHRKTVIFSPHLLADVAILDPALTASMPPRVTAATGFDALTHCVEAYLSKGDHPMADAIALGGIELCAQSLERAVTHGDDLAARGDMMKAAMMGAVAFQKGLGATHSLAHPLGSECGLHHGLANALCLPAVLDFNHQAVPARLGAVARLLGSHAGDSRDLAAECSGLVAALRARLGLPAHLAEEGVTEAQLPMLTDKAFQDACHQCNPRPCTREDLLALYRAAY